ncbi:MAG: CCA tRNA nucleotidyltransferase [Acetobacteraceae bacterium]|nr:CCA tRNA nucleotidyltransferase [Acetobacteraceae bacterium]
MSKEAALSLGTLNRVTESPALRIPPPSFLADPPLRAVLAALPDARLVGGCVRDTLAGLEVADIDLATPWRPEEVLRALQREGIRAIPTGLDHGTVTAAAGGRGFEITTLRRDLETDGRRARVGFTDDWREDAARRDFTINAMSLAPDGAVYDYFGGILDLRAGRVRFVGNPASRIAEDYLRILRFFRFFARYNRGQPDSEAIAAIRAGIPGISVLSAERVWSELKRILAAADPRGALTLMDELGVLEVIMPGGADPAALARLIEAGAPADPLLRLAALRTGDPGVLADRLKLSGAERDQLLAWVDGPPPDPSWDDAALRRALANTPKETLLARTWLQGDGSAAWSELRNRLIQVPAPVFPLGGKDVVALGVPPGPRVGELIRQVREWWMQGGCSADASACREELRRRVDCLHRCAAGGVAPRLPNSARSAQL